VCGPVFLILMLGVDLDPVEAMVLAW